MTLVKSLSEFVKLVAQFRDNDFKRDAHEELWFRGESFQYRDIGRETFLRPELYRPPIDKDQSCPLRDIDDLLEIESQQYDSFQHSAVQLSGEKAEDENWDWDSYFLMQHHGAPTRLLDWSDGALIALHFAVYTGIDCRGSKDATVYVLDPDKLKVLPRSGTIKKAWRTFARKHPSEGFSESQWEYAYLPQDKKTRRAMGMPCLPDDPLVLEFPHITRRVAAQRSRFVVLGRNPMNRPGFVGGSNT